MKPPPRVHVAATTITRMGGFTYEADWLVHMRRDQYEPWSAGACLMLPLAGQYREPHLPQLRSQLVGATADMLARLTLVFEDHECGCIPTPARAPEAGKQRRQEQAILDAITALGLDPLALEGKPKGHVGSRDAICKRAFADDHHHVFKHVGLADVAFQRLLKNKKIAYG